MGALDGRSMSTAVAGMCGGTAVLLCSIAPVRKHATLKQYTAHVKQLAKYNASTISYLWQQAG